MNWDFDCRIAPGAPVWWISESGSGKRICAIVVKRLLGGKVVVHDKSGRPDYPVRAAKLRIGYAPLLGRGGSAA